MTVTDQRITDITDRPQRIRILAEIPLDVFTRITGELPGLPDWDRYFIMNNPIGWPEGMYDVIERNLANLLFEFNLGTSSN
ncbi:MAG: hypothetical protein KKA42_02470 [candidate division Zixibacteria bacterium]|nr:hypothetical protein [candidate division Zixibacteria bacterium]